MKKVINEEMLFFWRSIIYLSRLPRFQTQKPTAQSALNLKLLYLGPYQFKKHFSTSMVRLRKIKIPSTVSKYELFSEDTAPFILDVEEERQKVSFVGETVDEFKGINKKRGVCGVFDISEIVDLLKKEKAEGIFVVKIPQDYYYVDYMVIVNGKSARHMLGMCDFIKRVYKKKKNANELPLKLEGVQSNTWMALDLGNIAVHVFSKTGREMYDLETLWSVGKDYDSLTQCKTSSHDLSSDFSTVLSSLSPDT